MVRRPVTGEGPGQLRHLATGQETRLATSFEASKRVARSRPDGRVLALVSVLGLGQLWDTATGRMTGTLQGFLQGAHSVAFSPRGQRLAIGSNGNEAIKLWDVESLQELLTLKGQGSMFNSTSFSPDDSLLASSNGRGILHIWSAPLFEEIVRLEARAPVICCRGRHWLRNRLRFSVSTKPGSTSKAARQSVAEVLVRQPLPSLSYP